MKTGQLLLGILLSFTTVNIQGSKIDSLEKIVNEYTSIDTIKVNLLNDFAYQIYRQDSKKAKYYAQESEKIASQINYLKGKATSLWILGITTPNTDIETALNYYQNALAIAEQVDDKIGMCNYLRAIGNTFKLKNDYKRSNEVLQKSLQIARSLQNKSLIIKTLINISSNYSAQGYFPAAIKELQEVIPLANQIGEKEILASANGQLGIIYYRQGNHLAALEYLLSALKINELAGNKASIINNLNSIGIIQAEQRDFTTALKTYQKAFLLSKNIENAQYMAICLTNIGNIYMNMENYTNALQYFHKVQTTHTNINTTLKINILMNIGAIYTKQREYGKAQKHLEKALALAQKNQLKRNLCEVWVNMGNLYYEQKQYQRSIEYIQQALTVSEEINYLDIQRDCCKTLSDLYAATGIFNKAYLNHVRYKALHDSIFNKENIRKMATLESSYKYAKEKQDLVIEKANQNMKIKSQKQMILFLTIFSILILALALTILWTGKLKKKVLKLEIENINHELETNRKTVTAATLKLIQNSERDAYSIKMLENIKKNTVDEGKKDIRSLISEYKFKSYNSNWDEFEIMFEKTNTEFYKKLNEQYPTLTPNERKLCVFLKLNMNNNHISQITFQSEEALKKARLRLRKKLGIDRDTNLTAFIQSL